jgi:alpha-mannosidase
MNFLSVVVNQVRVKGSELGRIFCLGTGMTVALLVSQNSLRAQTAEQVAEATKALSAQSQSVIQRLSELSILPSPTWKFHTGDLPHGEEVSLDDASWENVTPSSEVPSGEAAWYRSSIEVPKNLHGYDLSGSRIWFQFRFSGDGNATAMIYFNGRRVAMGEGLEPVVLFDKATPGEKLLVAVKLARTARPKRFRGSPMKIEVSEARPNPGDLWQEVLSASAFLGEGPNPSINDKRQLEKAITTVDLDALDRADQTKFDASLEQARKQLDALRPALEKYTFHLTGNSHIDSAWLWPWTETVEAVRRTFGTATQLMQEYPDYTFSQSAAQHSEWIAEKYPEINDQIRKRVKEGQWEIVGGMWVEPDLNMPDGESLVRQLLVGKRLFKSQYGVDVRIGWNPDSFGYTWQLPQIYKKSGVDYFVTAKLNSNETHKLPFGLFWWESPDGSKVLTYLARKYDNTNLSPARLALDLAPTRNFAPGLTELMDMYGVGDHGGGPTRVILDEGNRWGARDKIVPKMKFGTAQSYFSDVERKLELDSPLWNYQSIAKGYTPPPDPIEGKVAIPTWKDELYYEFHRGVMTTQANHKRNMRESEEWTLDSEKYASLAWLAGDAYPSAELTEVWKKVLFNQFHDLAAGSGIGVIYKDGQRDYDQVRWATNEVSAKALGTVAADVNTRAAGDVPIFVFNPLAWKRSGLLTVDVQMPGALARDISVLDAKNRVVPSKILSSDHARNTYKLLLAIPEVPSMGYTVLHAVAGARAFATDLRVKGLTLENTALRVTVDPGTGCITSLYDKKSRFESLAPVGCGNQLQTFADNPKCCDAWNIDPGTLDHPTILGRADSVELVEQGPLRATIRVTRSLGNSKFVQEITLYSGADQVDVVSDIDWHEKHTLLKVAFPLAASSENATYEIPYGTIERPTTRNNSWEETRFEVSALRWADLGDKHHGFSLINEAKYGYDGRDNTLRLSLLRSPTSPDPDADQGKHHFSYSLYPHAGDWKQALTERRGYEYNYKLTATQVESHSGPLPLEHSYLTVKPENVVLTAMKKAEDANGLLLRVVEWAGKSGNLEISVPHGAISATATNLMEKPEGAPIPVANGVVTIPIHPYEILSVRVDYAKRER